jgi:hypothetical protein
MVDVGRSMAATFKPQHREYWARQTKPLVIIGWPE